MSNSVEKYASRTDQTPNSLIRDIGLFGETYGNGKSIVWIKSLHFSGGVIC